MKPNLIRRPEPAFDATAWVARRYRVTPSHARLLIELSGLGPSETHHEPRFIKLEGRK